MSPVPEPILKQSPRPTGRPIRWEELTFPEVAELVERVNAAIIPVGAIEQHGPHLPLNVDTVIARAVAEGVSAETGVPVTPRSPSASPPRTATSRG